MRYAAEVARELPSVESHRIPHPVAFHWTTITRIIAYLSHSQIDSSVMVTKMEPDSDGRGHKRAKMDEAGHTSAPDPRHHGPPPPYYAYPPHRGPPPPNPYVWRSYHPQYAPGIPPYHPSDRSHEHGGPPPYYAYPPPHHRGHLPPTHAYPPSAYPGSSTYQSSPMRPHSKSPPILRGDAESTMADDNATQQSSTADSGKDKGRGSYKCGRCGVPKKGHVCPYQPKLKRRANEPPPETRNAAVQVEIDEFMTLRRLNIKIQGFPESYVSEPYSMGDSIIVGEASPGFEPQPLPLSDDIMLEDRGVGTGD